VELAAFGSYLLERCDGCGTAAVASDQRGEEAPDLYEAGTYGGGASRLEPLVAVARGAVVRDRMRFLRNLPDGARVLEVGCGDGRFLEALAREGHQVRGIEPAPHRAAAACARGLPVDAVSAEDARLPDASQDAVVFWHALEHLGDPGEALQCACGWLRPGGRLVVAAPNLASLQARLGGDLWFHQDVPRHLMQFTENGLVALVRRSGFRVVRVSHILLEHNVFGMWQSFLNRVTREPDVVLRFVKRSVRHGSRRDAALVAVAGPLLLLPAAALELAAGLLGRGGTIVVEAMRP
jgi:SAM-dependent methyltransferase